MFMKPIAVALLFTLLASTAQAGVCCQYGNPNGLSTNGVSSNGLKLNGLASAARVNVLGVELPVRPAR